MIIIEFRKFKDVTYLFFTCSAEIVFKIMLVETEEAVTKGDEPKL